MAKKMHPTPMLDQLESGPWPSFVTGLKRLAQDKDYVVDLMGQLETSYRTRKGYWKGGTVGVFGYGGGVIPRFTELKNDDHSILKYVKTQGGFLSVTVERKDGKPCATFRHHDVQGKVCFTDEMAGKVN